MGRVAHFFTVHEQAQLNQDCYFRFFDVFLASRFLIFAPDLCISLRDLRVEILSRLSNTCRLLVSLVASASIIIAYFGLSIDYYL